MCISVGVSGSLKSKYKMILWGSTFYVLLSSKRYVQFTNKYYLNYYSCQLKLLPDTQTGFVASHASIFLVGNICCLSVCPRLH